MLQVDGNKYHYSKLAGEPVFGGLTCYGESGPATFEASSLVATEGSSYNNSKFKI